MDNEKIAELMEKFLKLKYPGAVFSIVALGRQFYLRHARTIDCRDYLLKGKYTYDQVVELNNLTGKNVGFGYCRKIGPVAFIGMPDLERFQSSRFFYNEVQEYGKLINFDELLFNKYTPEKAKEIKDYTVYGMGNPRILQNAAPMDKIDSFFDYRYMIRSDFLGKELDSINSLEMQVKLAGTYTFYEARKFAYGSKGPYRGSSGQNRAIQFAIVDEKYPVGIIDLNYHYDNVTFKDVWGRGEEEPKEQSIRFLSDEEASKITNFKLYYFIPPRVFVTRLHFVEKKDRTLYKDFNFMMEDNTDYRLQNPQKLESHAMKLKKWNNRKF